MSKTGKTVKKVVLILLCAAILISAAAVGTCLFISRPALCSADEYAGKFPDCIISVSDDGSVELSPADSKITCGIIFYTGAQITPDAYIPLLEKLAENGCLCSIPKLPFNMAPFKPGAAEEIIKTHPEINAWYLAGHSLGGLTASGFADDHRDLTSGLILIAAYSNRDLSDAEFPVLSVLGDTDGVINKKLYDKRTQWNPSDFEEHILQGANHAGYGDYGRQPRDNVAKIPAGSQQAMTAKAILKWLSAHSGEPVK